MMFSAHTDQTPHSAFDYGHALGKAALRAVIVAAIVWAIAAVVFLAQDEITRSLGGLTPGLIAAVAAREQARPAVSGAYFPAQFPAPDGPLEPQPQAF